MYRGGGYMEDYILPEYIIDSISFGDISLNIENALKKPEFCEKHPLYKKYKDLFMIYAKAYMVYAICTHVSVVVQDDNRYKGNSIYYNYVRFKSDDEMVASEIDTLVDIFDSASQSNNMLRAQYIKAQLDFINLINNQKNKRYDELSVYDTKLYAKINELSARINFKVNAAYLVHLCKCYLVSKEDLTDEEYVCGSGNFLENVISDSYSIFEQSRISYNEKVESRNNDYDKIMVLKRIIGKNRLD